MDTQTSKSFWDKKEGITGKLIIAGIIIGAGIGLYVALPAIIVLLQNLIEAMGLTIVAGIGAGILFSAWMILSNKNFQTAAGYYFQAISKKLTGLIIEMDPIAMLEGYAKDLRKWLTQLSESITKLNGEKQKLKGIISSNEKEKNHSLNIAKLAHQQTDQSAQAAFVLNSRQAGRLDKSNVELGDLLKKMEVMGKVLEKMQTAADFNVQDIENEVVVQKQKRAAILASWKAYSFAKRILGRNQQKELFDQSLEYLANDYEMKVGEIEQFMKDSAGFLQTVDLENGVYEEQALSQITAWEKKADALVNSSGQKVRVEVEQTPAFQSNSFDDLFNESKTITTQVK